MDMLSDSKAREKVLSTSKKEFPSSSSIKGPLMITNGIRGSVQTSQSRSEITPTSLNGNFSRMANNTEIGLPKYGFELNEIHTAAEGLKQDLVTQNRCNICTLKPPCKHYTSCEEIPKVSRFHKKESSVSTAVNQMLPPLPRIQSTGVPKRGSLPDSNTEAHQNFTEKDTSFNSNLFGKDQVSIFRESTTSEPRKSRGLHSKGPRRVAPSDNTSCTIRIRSKNNIESFKGNVSRTISEQRATKSQKSKLREARKRFMTLEKIEKYRKEKMEEEVRKLELQHQLSQQYK
mmetsp:Transcript_32151/g.31563  ORF Transcript_32151/g.31563 Transcript_32151/m.31563 type:complete len:288 (+) Transcript_32151:1253-2116(+)